MSCISVEMAGVNDIMKLVFGINVKLKQINWLRRPTFLAARKRRNGGGGDEAAMNNDNNTQIAKWRK
jgi:hypothetical protein